MIKPFGILDLKESYGTIRRDPKLKEIAKEGI